MKYCLLALLFFSLNAELLLCQKFEPGIFFNVGGPFNSINFNSLPTVPRPNIQLTDTTGIIECAGIDIGFRYKKFLFGLRSDLTLFKTGFRDLEFLTVIKEGLPITAIVEHKLNTEFTILGAEPYFGYNLFGNNFEDLAINFGVNFGFPIKTNYTQTQVLLQPSDMQFVNSTGNHSGSIPQYSNVQIMPSARFIFELLNFYSIRWKGEIKFQTTVNDIIQNTSWRYSSLTLGMSFFYAPYSIDPDDYVKDPLYSRDTSEYYTTKSKSVSVKFIGRDTTYKKYDDPRLRIYLPQEAMMDANHRIRIYDIDKLYLVITDHYEKSIPKSPPLLNGELVAMFIAPDGVQTSDMEIKVNKSIRSLLYPSFIDKSGTLEFTNKLINNIDTIIQASIPSIRFFPKVMTESGLKTWSIYILTGVDTLKVFTSAADAEIPQFIDWNLKSELAPKDIIGKHFNYEFHIEDTDGQKLIASRGEIILKEKKNIDETFNHVFFYFIPADYAKTDELIKTINRNRKGKLLTIINHIQSDKFKTKAEKILSALKPYEEKKEAGDKSFLSLFPPDLPTYEGIIAILE